MLDARERRFNFEKQLSHSTGLPVVAGVANYPGADKKSPYSSYITYALYEEIIKSIPAAQRHFSYTKEGFIFHIVADMPPQAAKRLCIAAEQQHPLGRYIDLDVFCGGQNLSRRELGLPPRTCYLCGEPANLCVRSQRHDVAAVQRHIHSAVLGYIAQSPAPRLLEYGLINELVRDHGYGCVTVHSAGSHPDMSFETFLASIAALSRAIAAYDFSQGHSFTDLRGIGLGLERAMYAATGGRNTHKGFIFSYLFIIYAFYHCMGPAEMQNLIAQLAADIYSDFAAAPATNGTRIYREHGIAGVRRMARGGYRELFCDYLPRYKSSTEAEFLLYLISQGEDTTTIARSSVQRWQELRRLAAQALATGSTAAVERFIAEHGLTTGGSADIYALTHIASVIELLFAAAQGAISSGGDKYGD